MPERHNGDVSTALAAVRAVARAPFTGRARRELLYCLLGLPFIVFLPFVGFFAVIALAQLAAGPWVTRGNPSVLAVLAARRRPGC